jgi:predicted nucleic acid-binding protein
VDASLAVKWILAEQDQNLALRLYEDAMRAGMRLAAPPLLLGEVSSAVYKQYRGGVIDVDEAMLSLKDFGRLSIDSVAPRTLPSRAFEIAAQFRMKWIYDAFYVALAEIIGCDLWTADAALHAAVRDAHANVRLLADYPL